MLVPSYVLDSTGVVRWLNPAAERLVGDIRGRHFTSIVAPEDSRRARELFAQKMLGTSPATEATAHLVSSAGKRVAVEVSGVALRNGETVVGVFGLIEERSDDSPAAPPPHLTPRQVEVLRLLEPGCSTKQIAAELHLSTETVRGTTSAVSSRPSASTPDSKPSLSPAPRHPTERSTSLSLRTPAAHRRATVRLPFKFAQTTVWFGLRGRGRHGPQRDGPRVMGV